MFTHVKRKSKILNIKQECFSLNLIYILGEGDFMAWKSKNYFFIEHEQNEPKK